MVEIDEKGQKWSKILKIGPVKPLQLSRTLTFEIPSETPLHLACPRHVYRLHRPQPYPRPEPKLARVTYLGVNPADASCRPHVADAHPSWVHE
jgi:hypothetical protein